MNALSPHGQRAELQQEQLCSEKTAETEAAAPATHTDTRLVTLRPQDALHVWAGIVICGPTWSSLTGCDTAGTHSRIKWTFPDFTPFRVYHCNTDRATVVRTKHPLCWANQPEPSGLPDQCTGIWWPHLAWHWTCKHESNNQADKLAMLTPTWEC